MGRFDGEEVLEDPKCENHSRRKAYLVCPECGSTFCGECYEVYEELCSVCEPPRLERIDFSYKLRGKN